PRPVVRPGDGGGPGADVVGELADQGSRGRAAVADDLRRDPLADLAVRLGVEQEGQVGVGVGVDEAGGGDAAGGVEAPGRRGGGEVADGGDAPPLYANVRPVRRGPRAVDDLSAGEDDVHVSLLARYASTLQLGASAGARPPGARRQWPGNRSRGS